MNVQKIALNNTICRIIVGSHCYGTALPTSDTDIRGIVIMPREFYLGTYFNFEQTKVSSEEDTEFMDIDKFFKLCSDNNPNILEWLFVDSEHRILDSKYYEKIRENRDKFLSRNAYYRFGGYAHAQLLRLERHKKWIDNPPEKPRLEDYELVSTLQLENSTLKFLRSLKREERDKIIRKDFSGQLKKEIQFHDDMENWKKFLDWQKNRNKDRMVLEQKIGYDSKHGMHLIRLLEEGIELLVDSKISLPRSNAKILQSIRNAEWSYESLIEYANKLKVSLDNAHSYCVENNVLPKHPNIKELNDLLISIKEQYWGDTKSMEKEFEHPPYNHPGIMGYGWR